MPDVGAIIVAAGSAHRMGGVDKIMLPLEGKPLIAWSVDVCQACDLIAQIIIVLNQNNYDPVKELANVRGWSKVSLCLGGARRQDSVKRGLCALRGCEWVIIHDGARPFLTPELIRRGLNAAVETGAAVAAVPAKETIKLLEGDMLSCKTIPRDTVWMAQTPQVFRFDIINSAHMEIEADVTDDAELVEQLGYRVKLYLGSYENIKVTTPEDFALAEIIARKRKKNASWSGV